MIEFSNRVLLWCFYLLAAVSCLNLTSEDAGFKATLEGDPCTACLHIQKDITDKGYEECSKINNNCIIFFNETTSDKYLVKCVSDDANLDLSGNSLTKICPESFSNLPSLCHVDLSSNNLSSLPTNLFQSNSLLKTLDLSLNSLSPSNDDFIGFPRFLSKLNLSFNKLGDNPAGLKSLFSQLFTIQNLDLSANFLSEVPSFSKFIFLKQLNLSSNHLKGKL